MPRAVAAAIACFACLVPARAGADETPAIVRSTLPGWTLDTEVNGDLDRDGKPDLVVTLQRPGPDDDAPTRAMLAVFLSAPDGSLALHTQASRAVCFGCGGMKGQPDAVIGVPEITPKGVLVVRYEGGSRVIWSYTLRWRHDAKRDRFALIGHTVQLADTMSDDGSMEPGSVSLEDANVSTGVVHRTIAGKGTFTCRASRVARSDLDVFDFEAFAEGSDRFVKGSCSKVTKPSGRPKPARGASLDRGALERLARLDDPLVCLP